jgi:hypothetical protein
MAVGSVFATLLLLAPDINVKDASGQPLQNKAVYALFTALYAGFSVWSVWMIHWRKALVRTVLPALLLIMIVFSEISVFIANGFDATTPRPSYLISIFIISYLLVSKKAKAVLTK